jgi:PPM family protein phosphatase
MTLALHYALRSDVGLLREGNEDSAYAGPRLLAIADGMGGHAAGEVASAVAISAIAPLDRQNLISDDDMLNALADAVASARGTLHDMSVSDPAVEGMGTTLTAMLWAGARVAVCHIGDSRAYLLRDGDLYQITRDHTLIQSLVDEGRLSPAAAANHPQRSLIMRALQGSTDADPDLAMHDAILGDRYLLCSDGLTDVVGDEAVHHILSTVPDAEDSVNQLIALAIHNGGPDNITCIVADVVDTVGPVPPTTDARLAGAAAGGDVSALLRAATGNAPGVNGTDLQSAPSASLNGHRGRGAAKAADDDLGDDSFEEPRRRWPLVTSILVVLVVLITAGLYFGYRGVQGNYYLGADGSRVSIYRGVSQKIAFLSLSSVYQKTNVLTSEVPGDLTLPTTPTTLAKTRATLAQITQDHTCHVVSQRLTAWQSEDSKKQQAATAAKKAHARNKKIKIPSITMPPEPRLPSYCADGSAAG